MIFYNEKEIPHYVKYLLSDSVLVNRERCSKFPATLLPRLAFKSCKIVPKVTSEGIQRKELCSIVEGSLIEMKQGFYRETPTCYIEESSCKLSDYIYDTPFYVHYHLRHLFRGVLGP